MINKRKYPKLSGICAEAIKNQWCLGCQKLEDYNFTGVNYCKGTDRGKSNNLPNINKTSTEYQQLKI